MSDVTHILSAIEQGDPHAAAQLLPLVYDELRKLAVAKLAQEKPGQTLQATALVHEAYLRLVGSGAARSWRDRRHFFAAAARAMRRILEESQEHAAVHETPQSWASSGSYFHPSHSSRSRSSSRHREHRQPPFEPSRSPIFFGGLRATLRTTRSAGISLSLARLRLNRNTPGSSTDWSF